MKSDENFANHLNYYRELVTNGESKHVPTIAYNIFKKGFEEPDLTEGYTSIKRINFVPSFDSEDLKAKFCYMLC